MQVFDWKGAAQKLGNEIARGGEGSVFQVAERHSVVVKQYHPEVIARRGGELEDKVAVMPFTTAYQIDGCDRLNASGSTPMGEAVDLAIDRLNRRKAEYKKSGVSYYQPWLVLMSDGAPNSGREESARRLRRMAEERKVTVLCVGIGGGADLTILGQFSTRPAKQLSGMKFREFFQWLSQSMERVSQSSPGIKVALAATDSWDCA